MGNSLGVITSYDYAVEEDGAQGACSSRPERTVKEEEKPEDKGMM